MPELVPYGDTEGDGMVQISFTLPVPADARAREIGLQFLRNNGLREPQIVHVTAADREMTFYVAYGQEPRRGWIPIPWSDREVEAPTLGYYEINALIERELGRHVVVVGAAIESDAHTVGIDAIMNMKGFAGDYGLERYPWFDAYNLGAQVPCERLVREARERDADAILVSQVVTQKQVHARQLTKLVDLLEAEGLRDRFLLVGRRAAAVQHVRQGAWLRRRIRAGVIARRRWPRGSPRSWWSVTTQRAKECRMSEGLTVELRMRLSAADAHYGGNLVDGAHGLEIFGDIVTELAVHTDGDEGLFAGYDKVEFLAPMYGGDFVRATGTIVKHGQHQPHRRSGAVEGDHRPYRHQRVGGGRARASRCW